MGLFDILFGKHDSDDMSRDFFGKHGEFDNNDEMRDICEDMFGMHSQNPDADLEEHYGWENKLNYDGDGYSDDDNW